MDLLNGHLDPDGHRVGYRWPRCKGKSNGKSLRQLNGGLLLYCRHGLIFVIIFSRREPDQVENYLKQEVAVVVQFWFSGADELDRSVDLNTEEECEAETSSCFLFLAACNSS